MKSHASGSWHSGEERIDGQDRKVTSTGGLVKGCRAMLVCMGKGKNDLELTKNVQADCAS